MRLAAVLLALAACGRVHFAARGDAAARTLDGARDAPRDTPLGHDEDGDGIPDVDDPCPQVAGDAADRDGDGVGDACDPNPDAPTEHWALFATMQPGDDAFDDLTGFDQEADALHVVTGSSGASITRTVGTVRIDLGFDIRGIVGTGQHQVASGLDSGTTSAPYYFVELNDNNGIKDLAVVQYQGGTYTTLGAQDNAGAMIGPGVLRYDATIGAGANVASTFAAVAGWNGELDQARGATPGYAGAPLVRFAFNGVDIAIRYVAMIATN